MSAYRMWTLTCDGCGEVYDIGEDYSLAVVKSIARRAGWRTGRTRVDEDLCSPCDSIKAVEEAAAAEVRSTDTTEGSEQ